MTYPRVLIAGTHSGVGKTTVTLALLAAYRAQGRTVQPFKVGPDFIDPGHHQIACGWVDAWSGREPQDFSRGGSGGRPLDHRRHDGAV